MISSCEPGPILALLSTHHVITLASRDDAGSWAAAVFYANDGLDLYFMSSPRSRHVRSLAFDARLAGAIHGDARDWRAIVGLQVSGPVEPVAPDALARARAVYAARFPFIAGDDARDPALASALASAAWYRMRIDEAVVIDNTQGLGQRLRWVRDAPTPRAAASG